MSRRCRLVAGFLLLSSTLCFATSDVNAQVGVGYNKVVACSQSSDGTTIVLRLAQRKLPYKPSVQYLPGANGATLLVADFAGLVFPLSTRIIRPLKSPGIQEIHVGQFQDSPAIARITVIATDGNALKDVAFQAEAGMLKVKCPTHALPKRWTLVPAQQQPLLLAREPQLARQPQTTNAKAAAPQPAPQSVPQPAPDRRTSSLKGFSAASKALSTGDTPKSNEETPSENPPATTKGFFSGLMSKMKGAFATGDEESSSTDAPPQAPSKVARKSPATAPTLPSSQKPTNATASAEQAFAQDNDANVPAPTIEVTDTSNGGDTAGATSDSTSNPNTGSVVIKLKSTHSFAAKSFRISDPERYVVDFSDLPELTASEVPPLTEGPLVRSIRLGAPEPGKTRLVLDLSGTESNVRETIDGNTISFIVDRQKGASTAGIGLGNFNGRGLTIMLDAGHGGSDPGAQRGDIQEKEITLGIVKQLKKVLESRGAQVLLTRADDTFVSLEDRVNLTNSSGPTVFLSVHINALESTSDIHGIETYYQTEQSRTLADFIHNALVTNLQAPDRSVRKARFYVINHTPVPAVLAEVGFISNKDERAKLISSDYQLQVAEALAQGVMLYAKSRQDVAISKPDPLPGSNPNKTARSEERSKLLPKSFSPIAQTERTTR